MSEPVLLHLETSSKNCSVAISQAEKLLCLCEESAENYNHAEKLHLFIQYALEGAGKNIKEINAVSVGAGPGSYTGLRIGVSAAKGLCYGLDIPLLSINSLEALAQAHLGAPGKKIIYTLTDARRMEVYAAAYDAVTGKELRAPAPLILDQDGEAYFSETHFPTAVFTGDGCEKARPLIGESAELYCGELPSAQYFIRPVLEKFLKKQFEDTAYFDPNYLKNNYSA